MQTHVDAWQQDFDQRFPGRISAAGELRVRLLQLLHLVDAAIPQRFALTITGTVILRLADLALAVGVDHGMLFREALASSMASPHLVWHRFLPAGVAEPGLTIGGAVVVVAVLPPWRLRTEEEQVRHMQRRALAMQIMRLLPADDPDVGAQVDAVIAPLRRPPTVLH